MKYKESSLIEFHLLIGLWWMVSVIFYELLAGLTVWNEILRRRFRVLVFLTTRTYLFYTQKTIWNFQLYESSLSVGRHVKRIDNANNNDSYINLAIKQTEKWINDSLWKITKYCSWDKPTDYTLKYSRNKRTNLFSE